MWLTTFMPTVSWWPKGCLRVTMSIREERPKPDIRWLPWWKARRGNSVPPSNVSRNSVSIPLQDRIQASLECRARKWKDVTARTWRKTICSTMPCWPMSMATGCRRLSPSVFIRVRPEWRTWPTLRLTTASRCTTSRENGCGTSTSARTCSRDPMNSSMP